MNQSIRYYYLYKTQIGQILIEQENDKISKVQLNNNGHVGNDCILKETILIKRAYKQLEEYFKGERKIFNLPLDLHGTSFQNDVWSELMKIPYGETRTYLDIAKAIDCPKGARAVGMANNKNNIMIIIPCHRVIGSNNKLVGYSAGLETKQYLLNLEKNI